MADKTASSGASTAMACSVTMGTAPGPEHAERALQQLRRERRPVAEEQDERLMESRHHASAMVTQDATPYHGIDAVDHGMG